MRIRDLVEWHQNTFKKIDETREIDEGFFFGVKGGGRFMGFFFLGWFFLVSDAFSDFCMVNKWFNLIFCKIIIVLKNLNVRISV